MCHRYSIRSRLSNIAILNPVNEKNYIDIAIAPKNSANSVSAIKSVRRENRHLINGRAAMEAKMVVRIGYDIGIGIAPLTESSKKTTSTLPFSDSTRNDFSVVNSHHTVCDVEKLLTHNQISNPHTSSETAVMPIRRALRRRGRMSSAYCAGFGFARMYNASSVIVPISRPSGVDRWRNQPPG